MRIDGASAIVTGGASGLGAATAQRLAADVVFLHGGRLAESAPSDAFFAGPETEAARAFIEGRLLW